MSGQHANVKGAALTLTALLARLLIETRAELAAELAAERRPDGSRSARRAARALIVCPDLQDRPAGPSCADEAP
jgi:hypothetical protein